MAQKTAKANNCGCGADCEIGPATRNNYFTGKLLVERDFVDEQTYHRNKMRAHEKYLHGAGVVCGLKVIHYANSSCRDRYVSVERGIAIDCCGNEIFVPELDYFDITQTTAYAAISSSTSTDPVDVQVCVRYRECCIEEIPILYDDCSCDGIQTAPNRILESFAFDMVLAPKESASHINSPIVKWSNTIGVAQPAAFAFNKATSRGYVATAGSDLIQVSLENHATLSSYNLPAPALAIAVSNDGSRVYAAVPNATSGQPPQLLVLDTTNLPARPIWTLNFPTGSGSGVSLAVAPSPDDRLIGVIQTAGAYAVWATNVNNPTGGATPANPVQVTVTLPAGASLLGLAFTSDAKTGYSVVSGQPTAVILDLSATPNPTASVVTASPPATADPTLVAVIANQGSNQLVVATSTGTVALVDPTNPPTAVETATLSSAPVSLMVSPDSRWIYVLQSDGAAVTNFYALDVSALRAGTLSLPQPEQVQQAITSAQISASGDTIYAIWPGTSTDKTSGGILVLNVSDSECTLNESCHHCDSPDCVVLATIKNYMVGFQVLDPAPAPAPSPSADEAAKIARINNKLGRVILPSVQAVAEYLDCKIDHIAGTPGPQGPAGVNGINGTNGTDGTNGTNGVNGTNGTNGVGLLAGLTTINAISWAHNFNGYPIEIGGLTYTGTTNPAQAQGFVIQFSAPIDLSASGIQLAVTADAVWNLPQSNVFEVATSAPPEFGSAFFCRCPLQGILVPVTPTDVVDGYITAVNYNSTQTEASALAFVLSANASEWWFATADLRYVWLTAHGDFLVDTTGKSIDARFLGGNLPTGSAPSPGGTTYGIEGGIFESWFAQHFIIDPGRERSFERVNQANAKQLVTAGFTQETAKQIVAQRKKLAFADIEDLKQRVNLKPEELGAVEKIVIPG